MEDVFLKQYTRLNSEQKEAVDTIEGPVMVIAGPGTGKTQILTLRIANILKKTDTAPEQILALTFTESGVFAMRKRLFSIVGSLAYRVNIYTFHGFCNDVIARYPEYFPRIIGRTVLTKVGKIALMEKIIDTEPLDLLRPYGDPYYHVRSLLSTISDLKREAISPFELKRVIEKEEKDFNDIPEKVHVKGAHKGKMKGEYLDLQKHIAKQKELLIVYEAYEKKIAELKKFDYEDMILEAVSAIREHEDLRLILQESYQYLLADEHQDANASQNAVLELLSSYHENPNLFIVGDEKQAIFRFQGASLQNFLYFKERYKEAKVITLVENFRSAQNILDLSHNLITTNNGEDLPLPRPELRAEGVEKGSLAPITYTELANTEEEVRFVAERIVEQIKGGQSPREIAVLYRENKDAELLSEICARYNIPFVVHSESDALLDVEIAKLLLLLRAVVTPESNELVGKVLFLDFLSIPILDVYTVFAALKRGEGSLIKLISKEHTLSSLELKDRKAILTFGNKLLEWHRAAKNKSLSDTVELVMKESGFLTYIIGLPHALSALNKIDALLDELRVVLESNRSSKLADFLVHIDTLILYNMGIPARESVGSEECVSLMTVHKAKGLEFEHVYVTGLNDNKWGGKRSRDSFHLPVGGAIRGEEDDERRLLYVALTRAKKSLTLTRAFSTSEGKELTPSRFIEEIDQKYITQEMHTKENVSRPHVLTLAKESSGAKLLDKTYLKERFFAQGLAVTALNNYLDCVWRYFFVNLIRLPQSQTKHQLYGIAVHHALKEAIDRVKALEEVTSESFMAGFLGKLSSLPFSELDYEESLKKGERTLPGYFKKVSPLWDPTMRAEVEIKGVSLILKSGEELQLKGNLDRVDKLEGNYVRVIDYKTKKPMSRNEIEGNTKSSNGNEKRQLMFYKLLVDAHGEGKEIMKEGTIEFIEPTEKGNYISESFAITNEEVETLKETIRTVAEEITTLAFVEKGGCQKKDCEYCQLAKMIELEK
jgi:DNA helicase-2/ATP-dependent DNA helicase PcrA